MKGIYIFLLLCLVARGKRNKYVFLKREINFSRGGTTVTLLEVQDFSDMPIVKTLEQVRLEDDENLLEEQELIENMTTSFDNTNTTISVPDPALTKRQVMNDWLERAVNVTASFIESQHEMITLACSGFFIFLCGIILIWLMVNSNAHEIKPRKKRKPNYESLPQNEPEPFLTQSILQESQQAAQRYSIMDSRTESSTYSQRVSEFRVSKYRITEYAPEVRDPFQESFVKNFLRAQQDTRTPGFSSADMSLLEIEELLKEMLPDDQYKQVEQFL